MKRMQWNFPFWWTFFLTFCAFAGFFVEIHTNQWPQLFNYFPYMHFTIRYTGIDDFPIAELVSKLIGLGVVGSGIAAMFFYWIDKPKYLPIFLFLSMVYLILVATMYGFHYFETSKDLPIFCVYIFYGILNLMAIWVSLAKKK